ncbi:membrane protein [Sulfolobales archaeon HS-7]|nr:membrane protein [Sulfolobales archaeon HS-7]
MNRNKISGLLLFIGIAQFLLLMLLSEVIYPGYSISHNYISDLGVGKTALIFNSSIILLGVLLIASGALFTTSTVFRILIILTGIGAAGVGLFPETTGTPHLISALLAFLFSSLASFVTVRVSRTPLKYIYPILGGMGLVALTLFILKDYLGLGPGGMERFIVYPNMLWALGFANEIVEIQS